MLRRQLTANAKNRRQLTANAKNRRQLTVEVSSAVNCQCFVIRTEHTYEFPKLHCCGFEILRCDFVEAKAIQRQLQTQNQVSALNPIALVYFLLNC